jgi:hypothetical protein
LVGPKKPFSSNDDGDSGANDFMMSMLKENSEDLNALLNEVRKVADRVENVCELSTYKRVEEKINSLQKDIKELLETKQYAVVDTETPAPVPVFDPVPPVAEVKAVPRGPTEITEVRSSPIVMRVSSWDDFLAFASKAQAVSFVYRESDKMFEADALKNNQILAYIGAIPKATLLLKLWLSSRLEVPEGKIFEGTLATKAK